MPLTWGDVSAVTTRHILPYVTDQFYTSNPLFLSLSRKGIRLSGGRYISVPVLYAGVPGGSYRGFDTLDVSWVSQVQEAQFDWKQYYSAVVVDGLTEILNSGPDAVVSLMSVYLENARRTLEDKIGTDLYGSNTNPKALDGLQAAVDDGTNVVIYGGISRATNTWWKANYMDNGNAQITLTQLQTMYGLCTQGQTSPDLIVTNQTAYNEVWIKVQPQQRFGNAEAAGVGFPYIQFNGAKIMVDSHAAWGSFAGPNGFYFLNTEFVDLFVHKARDFYLTNWMYPTNQDARVAHLYWAGNIVVTAPRFTGKIVNVA